MDYFPAIQVLLFCFFSKNQRHTEDVGGPIKNDPVHTAVVVDFDNLEKNRNATRSLRTSNRIHLFDADVVMYVPPKYSAESA